MKKIFVTYANSVFKKSVKRLKKEVKSLKLFDDLYLFRPNDLPSYIKTSCLFSYYRGGGYWMWKPYVILEILKKMNFGDILVYADAGCKVYPTKEWDFFWDQLRNFDAIFFQYRKQEYKWGDPTLKNWIKKSVVDYFRYQQKCEKWTEKQKILAGVMLLKKTQNTLSFIQDWHDIIMFKPNLVYDAFGTEKMEQESFFIEHRHDQAILSALLLSQSHESFRLLPENCEIRRDDQCIFAARIMDKVKVPIKVRFKKSVKQKIGVKNYNQIKSLLK